MEIGRTDPHTLYSAGSKVLDNNVSFRSELFKDVDPGGLTQVQRDGLFAPIRRRIHGRDRSDAKRADSGEVANSVRLDLDDLSTLVGEDLAAVWSRDNGGEVQDLDPVERSGHVYASTAR